MKLHVLFAASLLALGAASQAQTPGAAVGSLKIDHPYARATMPGQSNGGGYLKVDNAGSAPDRLVGATAAISKTVELHTMKLEGDVMRMRQIDAIELPAGRSVELKPGGTHLMFIGLKSPLKAGERFPVTLRFEKAGEMTVDMAIEAPAGASHGMKH